MDWGVSLAPWETEGLSWADLQRMPGSVVCSNGIHPSRRSPRRHPAPIRRDTPSPYLPRHAARAGSAPRRPTPPPTGCRLGIRLPPGVILASARAPCEGFRA